jgi:hypothetical protein
MIPIRLLGGFSETKHLKLLAKYGTHSKCSSNVRSNYPVMVGCMAASSVLTVVGGSVEWQLLFYSLARLLRFRQNTQMSKILIFVSFSTLSLFPLEFYLKCY